MVSAVECGGNRPACDRSRGASEGAAQRLLAAAVSRETSARLTIVTDEGDRVTLSSRTAVSAGMGVYDFRDRSHAVHAETMQFSLSRDFELSVGGDLSAEELKDIRRVMNGVEKVTRTFLKGDLDGAAAKAAKMGELGSLAGFDYAFEQREAVVAAAVTQVVQAEPAPEAASEAPAVGDAAPAPDERQLDRATEDARAAVRDPVFDSPRGHGLLRKLLDGLFRHLEREDGRGWLDALRARLADRLDADAADAAPASSAG
jgi:hypothetical protein